MRPAISVIVTTFNVEDYVDRALSSVLDQEFRTIELIVVDDGSTDGTLQRVTRLLKGEPYAQVIAQSNGGPGAARNAGLSRAKGTHVVFLDGDDWLAPGAIGALVEASVGVDIVFSNRRRYWDISGKYTSKPIFLTERKSSVADTPAIMKILAIHGKMFRRSFLIENDIRFPVGMSSEDFVFSYHAYAVAGMVATIPTITYFYRKRGDQSNQSLTQARLTEFNLTSRFKQIELTQQLVKKLKMKDRFPSTRFGRLDYDSRLMRHVDVLPNADEPTRRTAFDHLRKFLAKHESVALRHARRETREIYKSILSGDDSRALDLIREKQQPTKGGLRDPG